MASTPHFHPHVKILFFVPILLPFRLPLKIIPFFWAPCDPPPPPPSWSAADLPRPDPQVPGQPDAEAETCITVRLTVASAVFGSAICPTGPKPYLTSPGTMPRTLKAPRHPGIDFFPLLQLKQRDFLSYMIYHNHIICRMESTGVEGGRETGRDADADVQLVRFKATTPQKITITCTSLAHC